MSTTVTEYKSRLEIFEDPTLPVYDKAKLLEAWDVAHPPGKTEREKILASGMNAYDAARAIEALPPEQPSRPKLSPSERATVAEAKINLEKLKAAYIEQVGNLERYRQAKDQTARELKRLEKEASPDKPEDIRSLGHLEIRLRVIVNRINDLPDNIRAIENTANSILGGVNQLFTRRFGMSKEFGGRPWSNIGFAALPTRIDGAVAEIETALNGK